MIAAQSGIIVVKCYKNICTKLPSIELACAFSFSSTCNLFKVSLHTFQTFATRTENSTYENITQRACYRSLLAWQCHSQRARVSSLDPKPLLLHASEKKQSTGYVRVYATCNNS